MGHTHREDASGAASTSAGVGCAACDLATRADVTPGSGAHKLFSARQSLAQGATTNIAHEVSQKDQTWAAVADRED